MLAGFIYLDVPGRFKLTNQIAEAKVSQLQAALSRQSVYPLLAWLRITLLACECECVVWRQFIHTPGQHVT
jgi:hypothetical protein